MQFEVMKDLAVGDPWFFREFVVWRRLLFEIPRIDQDQDPMVSLQVSWATPLLAVAATW